MKGFFPARGFALVLAFFAAAYGPSFALPFPADSYPESADVRAETQDVWLKGETHDVRLFLPETRQNEWGEVFIVRQARDAARDSLSVSFEPIDARGKEGVWSLDRRLSDGMPSRITIFPTPDENIRIVIRPEGSDPERGRSQLDLVVYGAFAVKGVPIGAPFVNLYAQKLSSLVSLTARAVPWDLLSPDPARYGGSASASSKIRDRLKTLVYLDDGAFDADGNPVLIETGEAQDHGSVWAALGKGQDPLKVIGGVNCSGFAKWIIDGIVRPRAGSGTAIEPLKTQTSAPDTHFTRPFRESRDLFFALDWTRNLASAVVTLQTGRTTLPSASGVDVSAEPFSGTCSYRANVGYPTAEILPLLYWLASREPGTFYLGAVSRELGNPPMRQYHHVVAFFPYFDEDGNFTVATFESAKETPIAEFIAANRDSFINLVRVRLPEDDWFEP